MPRRKVKDYVSLECACPGCGERDMNRLIDGFDEDLEDILCKSCGTIYKAVLGGLEILYELHRRIP